MAVFNHSMDWERSCILAAAVGTMERQLEQSIGYAKERRQFGQPIGKFQAVSHRIVDMKLRLEAARLLLYRLGWLKHDGKPAPIESALVKLHLSESFTRSSLDVLQIHGGYGYMTESELEREVRDAIASRIYSGTSDIQKNIVAPIWASRGIDGPPAARIAPRAAEQHPDRTAVEDGERSITYAELEAARTRRRTCCTTWAWRGATASASTWTRASSRSWASMGS